MAESSGSRSLWPLPSPWTPTIAGFHRSRSSSLGFQAGDLPTEPDHQAAQRGHRQTTGKIGQLHDGDLPLLPRSHTRTVPSPPTVTATGRPSNSVHATAVTGSVWPVRGPFGTTVPPPVARTAHWVEPNSWARSRVDRDGYLRPPSWRAASAKAKYSKECIGRRASFTTCNRYMTFKWTNDLARLASHHGESAVRGSVAPHVAVEVG
jgi:hypothetical protein